MARVIDDVAHEDDLADRRRGRRVGAATAGVDVGPQRHGVTRAGAGHGKGGRQPMQSVRPLSALRLRQGPRQSAVEGVTRGGRPLLLTVWGGMNRGSSTWLSSSDPRLPSFRITLPTPMARIAVARDRALAVRRIEQKARLPFGVSQSVQASNPGHHCGGSGIENEDCVARPRQTCRVQHGLLRYFQLAQDDAASGKLIRCEH